MHSGHHVEVLEGSHQEVTQELLERTERAGSGYKLWVLLLLGLFVLGVIGFIIRLSSTGVDDHTRWGYHAAIFSFLLTTAGGAPLVAIAMRAVRSHWYRPLARIAELYSVVGLLTILAYIPLVIVLPPTDDRRTIWIRWHGHAPHVYDTLAIVALVVLGLTLLYVSALPDLAAQSERIGGLRGRLARRLSSFWKGSEHQWRVQRAGLGVLGGLYFMFLIFVHFIIASDFAMSYVPGWKDAIFPAWHGLSALHSGAATVLVTAFVLRQFGGYKRYIGLNQFWSLSKILLAISILWAYFWFAGFMTFWYGRAPAGTSVIRLLMFENYRFPFVMAILFNFVLPFLLLLWNGVRKSVLGPALASLLILIGTFFDRIRIYVGAMSVPDPTAHALDPGNLPATVKPEAADVLILVGGVAGAVLLFSLAAKFISPVSIWENKEGMLYQMVKPFLKGKYVLMGKPE